MLRGARGGPNANVIGCRLEQLARYGLPERRRLSLSRGGSQRVGRAGTLIERTNIPNASPTLSNRTRTEVNLFPE